MAFFARTLLFSVLGASAVVGCGGKTVLLLGDVDASVEADAATPVRDTGVPIPDGRIIITPPGSCPDPSTVTPDSSCDAAGEICAGFRCDGTVPTSCICSSGLWSCDGTCLLMIADAALPPSCPDPGSLVAGSACSGDLTCPQNACDGGETNTCTCMGGLWACQGLSCGQPPPPEDCAPSKDCFEEGETCTELGGGGPCGSNPVLICTDDFWRLQSYSCTGNAGCGTAGGDCSESCQCTNGTMVCTGDCDGGLPP